MAWKGGRNNRYGLWILYHSKGNFLWAPPPEVIYIFFGQLRESHKCPDSLHILICLKLMITLWGTLLYKVIKLFIYAPPPPQGVIFWPTSMSNSFVIVFISPLIPHRLWRLRGTPKILGLGRLVYYFLREIPGDADSVLCQLQLLPKRVASMLGVLAWGLLHI